MRAERVKQSLSQDIEKEIIDREKAEERCEKLEEAIRTHIVSGKREKS